MDEAVSVATEVVMVAAKVVAATARVVASATKSWVVLGAKVVMVTGAHIDHGWWW